MALRDHEIGRIPGRAGFKGVEGPLLPSFSRDFATLDRASIARDVELGVSQGFDQLLCMADTSLSEDEIIALVEIGVSEAAGRVAVGLSISGNSTAQALAVLRAAADRGAGYAVVGVPLTVDASVPDAVATYYEQVDRASDLPIILRISPELDLTHVHPSGVPSDLFDRIVELPHLAGLRLELRNSAVAYELFERYADRVQVTVSDFFSFPLLHHLYGMNWWAGWLPDALQRPERPYVVELFRLFESGRIDEAMELYWRLVPVYRVVDREFGRLGSLPYVAFMKFCQELAGGSGGPARESAARVTDEQRTALLRLREQLDASARASAGVAA